MPTNSKTRSYFAIGGIIALIFAIVKGAKIGFNDTGDLDRLEQKV